MLKDIVAATAIGEYRLSLRFEDGVEGIIDLARTLSFRGVFEPLKDTRYFAQARVDAELGTVVWPNGADLDPTFYTPASPGGQSSNRWKRQPANLRYSPTGGKTAGATRSLFVRQREHI